MPTPSFARRALPVLLALSALPHAAAAQLIPVRTVPVAAGDQFLISPSQNLGMGSVSIALADTLLDPFVNPAKGVRLERTLLFGAPAVYTISNGNGGAQTLPVGGLFAGRRWFGGASAALQQVQAGERFENRVVFDTWGQPRTLRDESARNLYASAQLGTRLSDGRTALAAGLAYAGLNMVDGVDLLYAGSQRIDQEGHQLDLRLGMLREMGGDRSVELLLLHNRFDVSHDATYRDVRWDPVARRQEVRTRVEHNRDHTDTWGAHLGHRRPLGERGWKVGGIITGNYKNHPKIPNYEIMNIPRDPGHSWAYNLGVGISRTDGPATVAIDAIYEPIWSNTWADADTARITRTGGRIEPGEKTIENDFAFTNFALRTGVGRQVERWGFQLGLQVRSIGYQLDQYDYVGERGREQEESWMEWVPTWGLAARFPEFQLRYAGRITTGTGRPGVAWAAQEGVRAADVALASNFIIAPSGPLTLRGAHVLTHQVTASIPIQ
ncbi:MAG: hypothetical protein KY464_14885 [Gemmatimonadetes bacterium]|nr:hypothetical protein [Gemmatimonadota bacterium]